MNELIAEFQIVTPMFLGGADQKVEGVRAPSVKGALRFWWRVLAWPRFAGPDVAASLCELHAREARLWGAASGEEGCGQSRVLLEVTRQPGLGRIERDWPKANTGAGYLGYGLPESSKRDPSKYRPHREAISELGESFELRLLFRPQASEKDLEEATAALRAWGLLGGLGSRSRRGFGSVQLVRLGKETIQHDRRSYETEVGKLLATASRVTAYPPYTALSAYAQLSCAATAEGARGALELAGQKYKKLRDAKTGLRGRQKIPFGLPLKDVDNDHRRASPLFFHVHRLQGARGPEYGAFVLFLPATFHPKYPCTDLGAYYREVRAFVTGLTP